MFMAIFPQRFGGGVEGGVGHDFKFCGLRDKTWEVLKEAETAISCRLWVGGTSSKVWANCTVQHSLGGGQY